ncbi:MAG: single-stranded DNA-binding protein, partial [Gemmatimonadales bacterium]
TRSEHSVSTLRVAIQRPSTREGEDRGAVFYDVEVWNGTAENCVRYLSKGSRIAVVGRLELDQWKDENDLPRQRSYVVASQVNFLDPSPAGGEREEAEPEPKPEPEADAEPIGVSHEGAGAI